MLVSVDFDAHHLAPGPIMAAFRGAGAKMPSLYIDSEYVFISSNLWVCFLSISVIGMSSMLFMYYGCKIWEAALV